MMESTGSFDREHELKLIVRAFDAKQLKKYKPKQKASSLRLTMYNWRHRHRTEAFKAVDFEKSLEKMRDDMCALLKGHV